jgi:serine/threonine-protein kinase HipA
VAYPTKEELENFGHRVCGVTQPARTLERIAQAMHNTIDKAKGDLRVPKALQEQMAQSWETGYGYAR